MKTSVLTKLLAMLLVLVTLLSTAACSMPDMGRGEQTAHAHDSGNQTTDGEEDSSIDESVNNTVTAAQAAAALSGLFGNGDYSTEALFGAIPTFAELMDAVALTTKKDEYVGAVKSALDGLNGEVGQLRYTVSDGEETVTNGNTEMLYAGIKDGQLYMQIQDPTQSANRANIYICYDDSSVYCIADIDSEDGNNMEAVQYPYSDMYDELAVELPALEAQYNELMAELTESVGNVLSPMTFPALQADALTAVKDKSNTYRLTDGYIKNLAMQMLPAGDKEAEAMLSACLEAIDVYLYVTMEDETTVAGMGLFLDVDVPALCKAMDEEPLEGTCKLDVYAGTDQVSCKVDYVIPDQSELHADFLESEALSSLTLSVIVPDALTLDANSVRKASYDEKTGDLQTYQLESTMGFDCHDSNVFGDSFMGLPLDGAGAFKGELSMDISLDLTKLKSESASIFSWRYAADLNGDAIKADVDESFSVSSQQVSVYSVAAQSGTFVQYNGETAVNSHADISFRLTWGAADKFLAIPKKMTDALALMKKNPDLWRPCAWCGESLAGAHGVTVDDYGKTRVLCASCYEEYQYNLTHCYHCEETLTGTTHVVEKHGSKYTVCEDCYQSEYCCKVCQAFVLDGHYFSDTDGNNWVLCDTCYEAYLDSFCYECHTSVAGEKSHTIDNKNGPAIVVCDSCYYELYVCGFCNTEMPNGCDYSVWDDEHDRELGICESCYAQYATGRCWKCDRDVGENKHTLTNQYGNTVVLCDQCYDLYYVCSMCHSEMPDGYEGSVEDTTELYLCKSCYTSYLQTHCYRCNADLKGKPTHSVTDDHKETHIVCEDCYQEAYVCKMCGGELVGGEYRWLWLNTQYTSIRVCMPCYDRYVESHCGECDESLTDQKKILTDEKGDRKYLCTDCYNTYYVCSMCRVVMPDGYYTYFEDVDDSTLYVCYGCFVEYNETHCRTCRVLLKDYYTITPEDEEPFNVCVECYQEKYICVFCQKSMKDGKNDSFWSETLEKELYCCQDCYTLMCDRCCEEKSTYKLTDSDGYSRDLCGGCYFEYYRCYFCDAEMPDGYYSDIWDTDMQMNKRMCESCYDSLCDCCGSTVGEHSFVDEYGDDRHFCDACFDVYYSCYTCGLALPNGSDYNIWNEETQSSVVLCERCYEEHYCDSCYRFADSTHFMTDSDGAHINVCDDCYDTYYICFLCKAEMPNHSYGDYYDAESDKWLYYCESCGLENYCQDCGSFPGKTHPLTNEYGYTRRVCDKCYEDNYICCYCLGEMPNGWHGWFEDEETGREMHFCTDCYLERCCDDCSATYVNTTLIVDSYGTERRICDLCMVYYVCNGCGEDMPDGAYGGAWNAEKEIYDYYCQSCYVSRHCVECGGFSEMTNTVVREDGESFRVCDECYYYVYVCAACGNVEPHGCYAYVWDDEQGKTVPYCQTCYETR